MPSVPIHLSLLILVFVILPFFVAISYRSALYQHLVFLEDRVQRLIHENSPGEKPKIIEKLEVRFRQASRQLDNINTSALIDQLYNREKVRGFTCEQIDYFCRILPNLLLAFGLFGTVLGITINLSAIYPTIDQNNPAGAVSSEELKLLFDKLKTALQGMSTAFITSLAGILFSALLTLFNWFKNTTIAKYKLISSLEDYLDNIYHPQVQGDTRLDKIVNRMVSQQEQFLNRFGFTVREAVEKSIGSVAKQIADGNKEATALAKQVYERFTVSAGTISSAANEFKHTITEMDRSSYIFKESAEIFEKSQFPHKLSATIADLTVIQGKFSQSAESLAKTTQLIETAIIEIQRCSQEITTLGIDIKTVNQTSIEVLSLHRDNQNYLGEIIPKLNQGAQSFSKAIEKLKQLEEEITKKSDSLSKVETILKQLVEVEKNQTLQMNLSIDSLGERLITISEEYQNMSSLISKEMAKQTNINQQGLKTLISELQKLSQNLNNTRNEIDKLTPEIEKQGKKL
ncbi:MotA/TolQ/ExbB proton channel family protein [Aetokthonos hydrillicola Thurmond2011]|jgi:regulator of replication initiation timing|uniref:MotA/TolQ/ExbB proton channel family protein n=1 Tax=Aetokthonos hydrillicola Thurmond2011 TaxID=2712845 RepID=A0AAP5MD03_9CYAN|nr:MotA/TolQ/ExbB proton channel family protein [Aetokthonos hydrillicola]MBO3462089.1 hypothetical protein [Aetokthonos hydrillicola CCALA 1050]MBW4585601.1 MotA/TolQ/ExbB proton channel family protein [Aetokthonos hydrillicola CCALA 1050]MDR9900845.1 MotA/TolQ/ExbB proton channel family protein [Aetokthonos hydrillicola Thurmond2011]